MIFILPYKVPLNIKRAASSSLAAVFLTPPFRRQSWRFWSKVAIDSPSWPNLGRGQFAWLEGSTTYAMLLKCFIRP